jgi:hypothetical protein
MKCLKFRMIMLFLAAFPSRAMFAGEEDKMTVVGAQEEPALQPLLGNAWTIYLNGPIDSSASKRLELFLISNNVPRQSWVILNSPGGNLAEGMELGNIIRKYELRTDVGIQEGATPSPLKFTSGVCYSACTLAYVGGAFRFLKTGSHFGIHRFAFTKPEQHEADLAQIVSASIVTYLRSMGVDPDLFALSTKAGSSDIYEPSVEELAKLNVVNSGFTKPKWTVESSKGIIYLKGERDTVYGINKFMLGCAAQTKMELYIIFDPQRHDEELMSFPAHFLVVDEVNTPISPIFKKIDHGWFNVGYILSPEQIISIRHAKTLGVIVQAAYGAPVFLGFDGMPFDEGGDKLDGLLNSCGLSQLHEFQMPKAAPPISEQNVSEADMALARRVAYNFSAQYKKLGIAGIRHSVTRCYQQAVKSLKYSAFEYCYLLDQIACDIDSQTRKDLPTNRVDEFCKSENALARTYSAARSAQVVPEIDGQSIARWFSLKPMVLSALARFN